MASPKRTRVIIIGAGWSGLVTAKTYLQLANSPTNPNKKPIELTLLDDNEAPGGVWSPSRLYPGLVADSPNGLYEYSDFSMVDAQHKNYDAVSGRMVQEYLEAYAKRFNVYDKIRFGVTVSRVRRRNGEEGWNVETSKGEVLTCEKLIISSGLHSKPKLPEWATSPAYKGVSIHTRLLGQMHEQLAKDPEIKDIIVVGGRKSAVEAVTLFLDAESPKRIHWIVRPSEQGVPIVVLDRNTSGPNLIALNNTRMFSMFSPSVFATSGFWYTFLHSGRWLLGTLLMKLFWMLMSVFVKSQPGYQSSRNGKAIEPKGSSLFFDVPYITVLPRDSKFFKALHADDPERLEVLRAKTLEMKDRGMLVQEKVDLENGGGWYMKKREIKADAIIWCTGWQPSIDFFDEKQKAKLGLPYQFSEKSTQDEKVWSKAAEEANTEIKKLLPYLAKNKPRPTIESTTTTPFRLYNAILPVSSLSSQKDRSIAFTSMTSSSQTPIVSELSALYAVAWLENLTPEPNIPSTDEAIKSISKVQSWRELRYGPRGTRDPEILLETQGFLDKLCSDLGLQVSRKQRAGKGRMKEWREPYRASDYQGIIEEFLNNLKEEKDSKLNAEELERLNRELGKEGWGLPPAQTAGDMMQLMRR